MGWVSAALTAVNIMFGGDSGDVEFPDGTTVTDPMTDAQGQVYKTPDDYYHGNDPYQTDGKGGTYK